MSNLNIGLQGVCQTCGTDTVAAVVTYLDHQRRNRLVPRTLPRSHPDL